MSKDPVRIELDATKLNSYIKELERAGREFKPQTERTVKLLGNRFRRVVKVRTPVRPGGLNRNSLQKSYIVSKPVRDITGTYVNFRSKSKHYHLVERGFTSRAGKKHKGIEMVKNTSIDFEKVVAVEAEKVLKRLVKKIKK